ncbi:MAG: 16S rRNA (uracil(1498)-N(3))-methyltransferase [Candidatus Gastranaerophilales bacterium]|nr:16S rRNA (uracil(1498)-N(3))-methyltransferase [Candidatus Gastranaerophilales bacterium]
MPHFFINSKSVKDNKIIVDDKDNYNHIVKSLRTKVGEKLLLIDENEIEYVTTIESIDNKSVRAVIESFAKSDRDLPYNLYLAQSPLRSDAQITIIEKATELGVRGIYPVYTDNCALKRSVAEAKVEKWQKVMFEASKQCERANIPKCYGLTGLETLLKDESFDRIIALCERNTNGSLKEYLRSNQVEAGENVLLIIGPEGGFSQNEFELLKKYKLPMLTLGDLILKAETAVIVTLGNIVYELGK